MPVEIMTGALVVMAAREFAVEAAGCSSAGLEKRCSEEQELLTEIWRTVLVGLGSI